jgi:hypothetical protein
MRVKLGEVKGETPVPLWLGRDWSEGLSVKFSVIRGVDILPFLKGSEASSARVRVSAWRREASASVKIFYESWEAIERDLRRWAEHNLVVLDCEPEAVLRKLVKSDPGAVLSLRDLPDWARAKAVSRVLEKKSPFGGDG